MTGTEPVPRARKQTARDLGNEVAAQTEGAFGSLMGPHGSQIDADGGKDGNVEDRQHAFRELFRMLEFEGNSAETKVQNARAPRTLLANDGVGIRTSHGNAFGFALDGISGR